jgi:hypothetical protein
MTVEELADKVAAALEPRFNKHLTGAVARHVASLREEFGGKPKGDADPSKSGDDKQSKADPRDIELTKLRDEVKRLSKEQDAAIRDARDGVIRSALSDYEALQGKKITGPGREFGILALEKAIQRMEDRTWIAKNGDDTKTVADYVAQFFGARPELLASSARAGTGATGSKGAQPPPSDMPKTKAEVRFTITKDAITGKVNRIPRGLAYVNEFKRAFPEVWASLPDGDF